MPFQFPDPSVSTKATLPNGEEWEYVNGAWQAVALLLIMTKHKLMT